MRRATTSRHRSVARSASRALGRRQTRRIQSSAWRRRSRRWNLRISPACDDRFGRRIGRQDAFDHDRLVARTARPGAAARSRAPRCASATAASRSRAAAGGRCLPRPRARAAAPRPGSRDAAARSAATPRTAAPATRKPAMPTDFHSSRCRASSTSRTIGLLRTSFLIAYSKASIRPFTASVAHARPRELRAARARVALHFLVARHERLLGQHLQRRASRLLRARETCASRCDPRASET